MPSVDEFCKACDGLPLSLKVFGGLLCENCDKSYWKGLLNDLRRAKLHNEILQTLKLSYDALGVEEKQIFLDIACYFIGENMDMAIRIWDGAGWSGLVGLQNLQAKCLVEVDGENTLKMHDHLRDMGRAIADQEKSSGVTPHRLWPLIEDIPDLWQRSSVITEVRGIRTVPRFVDDFGQSEEKWSIWLKTWCDEVFGNCLRKLIDPYYFSKLQLIATENGDLESILRRVESPNLIWLCWNGCPYTCLPYWITMKNTRVLEVSGNKLETLWRSESQAPLELRELTICSPLLKFPKSIGQLKHIEKIVVKKSNLKSLPEEFCQLRLLEYLVLSDSNSLQMLPKYFGFLENLQHLRLSGCKSLQMLPDTFGNLIHLKHLNLCDCSSLTLSEETFANITTLEHLNLTYCSNVGALPPEVAHQSSLEYLFVAGTGLKELPEDIGNLSNLETLELGGHLETLPSSLGHLSNLKTLILLGSELKSLPDPFGRLTQLSRLEYLLLWNTKVPEISFIEGVCPTLKSLIVYSCDDLVEVGALPPTLTRLSLRDCGQLRKMEGIWNLTILQELDIRGCREVEELPGLERLISLKEFSADGCSKLKRIGGLGQQTQLRMIRVSGCVALEEIASAQDLMSLEKLNIVNCPKLQWGEGVLNRLREQLRGGLQENPL